MIQRAAAGTAHRPVVDGPDVVPLRVLRQGVGIVRRHAVGFAIVAVVVVLLPGRFGYLISDALSDALDGTRLANRIGDDMDVVDALIDLVPDGLTFLGKVLLDGIAVLAAVSDARGVPPRFRDCLGGALRLLPTNLAVAALVLAGSVLGSLLFVLPGLLLHCAWAAAVPVATAERVGVFAALERSWSLTAGHRWRILGLVVPYLAALYGAHMIEDDVPSPFALQGNDVWIGGTLGAALETVLAVIASASLAALYLRLDRLRHDLPTRNLIAAFE